MPTYLIYPSIHPTHKYKIIPTWCCACSWGVVWRCDVELETKVRRKFATILQSQRRPRLGPSHGCTFTIKNLLKRHCAKQGPIIVKSSWTSIWSSIIHPVVVQYSLWIKGEDNGASARNMAAWPQLWVVIWATRWWSLIDHNDWAVRFSKFTNLSHQLSEHFYIISTTINLDISIIYNLDNFELTRSKQLLVTIIWTWSDRDKWYL